MLTVTRRLALLAVLCAPALPAAAQVTLPGVQGRDGVMMVDINTYRATALNQRLWALQDQRRRLEADLSDSGTKIQTLVGESLRKTTRLKALGIASIDKVATEIQTMEAKRLRAAFDLASRERAAFAPELPWRYIEPLQKALKARVQIDAVDVEIGEAKSKLSALD